MDFTSSDKPKLNGPIGISGWQTGPSVETTQQTPGVLWGSGDYTKIIGADHQAIVNKKYYLNYLIKNVMNSVFLYL